MAKTIDRTVALRSAADEKVQAATRHRLEPIARVLPPNPRQIKRIINAIALFQEIARIRMAVQPDTTTWRQLTLWIVLMTEWPRTWTTLATWPNLVTRVHDREDATPIEGLDDKIAVHWVKAIRANPQAMALLDFPSSNDVPDNWKDSKIDAEAVRALTVILPPTSGEALPKPDRKEEDSKDEDGDDGETG